VNLTTSNKKLSILLALCIIFAPVGAAVAGGFALAGVGAKALAMSGAFRAIADDWSAMYWNPAGLVGQESAVYLEAKALYPMAWVTPNTPSTTGDLDDYMLYRNGIEQSSDAATFPSGAFAFQYKINEKMTVGISGYAPSAIGVEWTNLFTGPYQGYGEDPAYPSKAWSMDLKILDFHPTVGYKVNDKLKVGLGIAIKYASVKLQSPKVIPSNDGTGNRLPMPAHHFFVDAVLDGHGVGCGFNIGVLCDLTEDFHLGLCYNGPVTVPIEGSLEQTLYMPRIADQENRNVKPDAETDFPMPMDFGIGLAFDVTDRLTVGMDVVWTNWEALDKIDIELEGDGLDGNPAEDSALELYWEDTYRFNFGLNYVVYPEKGFDLRLGYYFDPTTIPDKTLYPSITDVADKHNFSIGANYNLTDNIFFEAYWEHLFTGERTATEASDNDGDGMFDNLPGDWKLQVDTFGFQFGYRF